MSEQAGMESVLRERLDALRMLLEDAETERDMHTAAYEEYLKRLVVAERLLAGWSDYWDEADGDVPLYRDTRAFLESTQPTEEGGE